MDGKVLFMRGWPYFYRSLAAQGSTEDGSAEAAPRVPFGVAPLPEPSALGGQNLAIAAHTDQPRAAQALIEFLTSARSQQILFERGGFAATHEVVYRDGEITKKYPYADDVLKGIQRARVRPVTPYYNQFSQEFAGAVHEALQKGTPPDQADLKKKLEDALKGG